MAAGAVPHPPARHALSKVPQVTAYFWVIKVLTTFLGEATSDYLVHTISPYLAVGLGFVAFALSLAMQFAARRYRPWVYWTTVAMVAVFGTMAADVLHVALGVPYFASSAFFAVALGLVFLAWYRTEGTLSIHGICTPRREVFYWSAVVTAFALGTATGDLTAKTVGLGFLGSGVLFTAVIALPALAYRLGLDAIASFWIAYVVTRPVGASFADWLGFPPSDGGAGAGHGPISLLSALAIMMLVAYLAVSRKDTPGPIAVPQARPASPAPPQAPLPARPHPGHRRAPR